MAGAALCGHAFIFLCFYKIKRGGGVDNSAGAFSNSNKQYKMHFAVASLHFASEALGKRVATSSSVGADFANSCSRLGAARDSV